MNLLILLIMAVTLNKTLTVKSPAFPSNSAIPAKYTCEGDNINPELQIGDIPKEAKALALIVEDPDAPKGTFDHWIMWNIPVTDKIKENTATGMQGQNGRNESKYYGPCPPSGTHHYHFKVYALDEKLDLPASATKQQLLDAMEEHTLATGELVGLYSKKP
jgi:hypothetical protein